MRWAYDAEEPGEEAANAAEDGKDAAHDGGERGPEGDLVGDKHPFGHIAVGVERVLGALAQQLVLQLFGIVLRAGDGARHSVVSRARAGAADGGRVQLPHIHDVEVELSVLGRAVVRLAIGRVGRAVVPQVDLVYISQQVGVLGILQRELKLGVVVEDARVAHREVGEVGLEEVVFTERRAWPAGELDQHETHE